MRRTMLPGLAIVLGLTTLAVLVPEQAYAQRRVARVRAVRPVVVVSAPFYRPYHSAFFWQGYPYPYPPYRYGYRYRYDYLSEVRIQGTPREAQVYVDGYFVGVVDDFDGFAQRLRVEPGEHDIQIYLEGYKTRTERMLLRPNTSYRLRFALEPIAPGEPAEPRPSPSATAPAESGRYGTPARGPRPPAARDAMGTLSIRVQPVDAVILIDGERWESAEGEGRVDVEIAEGPHRVEVRREGLGTYETTVSVRRGEVTPLNVSLPRR